MGSGSRSPGGSGVGDVVPEGITAVDVDQSPEELRRASVSLLLAAFRSHGPGALCPHAARGRRPSPRPSASIAIRPAASSNGRAGDELAPTLRNRVVWDPVPSLPEGPRCSGPCSTGGRGAERASNGGRGGAAAPVVLDYSFTVQVALQDTVGSAGWGFGRTGSRCCWTGRPRRTSVGRVVPRHADGSRCAAALMLVPRGDGHWLADAEASSHRRPRRRSRSRRRRPARPTRPRATGAAGEGLEAVRPGTRPPGLDRRPGWRGCARRARGARACRGGGVGGGDGALSVAPASGAGRGWRRGRLAERVPPPKREGAER